MKTLVLLFLFALMMPVHADESEIRESFQSRFPGTGNIDHIVKTPYSGLYEVVIDDQLFYTDSKGEYLFDGRVIDTRTRRDLSEERRRVLFAIDFNQLPLDLAVKKVKGNGKRKLAIFTDPNCSYCRKLERELSQITDVTIYFYMYPIFPGSDVIVRNVLCARNPMKAWDDWMLSEITPAKATCKTQTDKVMALARKLHVNGTPNLIFANGTQAPGVLPVEELEKNLSEAKAN
jgi:thiol:disulfide interchange protein DsbC